GDWRPGGAAIVAAHQAIGGDVQAGVLVRADDERDVPARAERGIVGGVEARADGGARAGLDVEADSVDLLRAGVDRGGVLPVGAGLETVAAAGVHPVAGAD